MNPCEKCGYTWSSLYSDNCPKCFGLVKCDNCGYPVEEAYGVLVGGANTKSGVCHLYISMCNEGRGLYPKEEPPKKSAGEAPKPRPSRFLAWLRRRFTPESPADAARTVMMQKALLAIKLIDTLEEMAKLSLESLKKQREILEEMKR